MHPRSLLIMLSLLASLAGWLVVRNLGSNQSLESTSLQPVGFDITAWANKVESTRKLKFISLPEFKFRSTQEIQQLRLRALNSQYTAEQGAMQIRSFEALGFRWLPDYPWAETLAGLQGDGTVAWYDNSVNTLYLPAEADFMNRPDLQDQLATELCKILLRQNFPQLAISLGDQPNDDVSRARDALVVGDAILTTIRLRIQQAAPEPTAAQAPQPFWQTPQSFRDLVWFPKQYGRAYLENLLSKLSVEQIDDIYQQPPSSTMVILAGGSEASVTKPVDVTLRAPKLPGSEHSLANTLGEFGIMTLLRSRLTGVEADEAARGWSGDRYRFYPQAEAEVDGLIWKSAWATPKDAQEFHLAAFHLYLSRYGLLESEEMRSADGTWTIQAGNRQIQALPMDPEAHSVIILAGSAAFVAAARAEVK